MANAEVTRLKHLANSTRDAFMIDPRIIVVVPGHNPRSFAAEPDAEDLRLAESIRENGTLIPMVVRYDRQKCILVDGERRLRANMFLISQGVEIDAVPAIQVTAKDEAEQLVTALLANDKKPLKEWEEGFAFRRFERFGWSIEKIAQRMSRSPRYIRAAMELSDSPQDVKAMLEADVVTPAVALAAVRAEGSAAGQVLKEKLATAKEHGKEKASRIAPNRPPKIGQVEARTLADALRTIIRESPNSKAATTARTALEGAGLEEESFPEAA